MEKPNKVNLVLSCCDSAVTNFVGHGVLSVNIFVFFNIGVAFDFLCSPLWSKTDVNVEHGSIRLSK